MGSSGDDRPSPIVPAMTRRALVAALAAAALLGCSRGRAPERSAKPLRRIVSTAPAATEALFAIGAGSMVVGRSRFCDWPPEASHLPSVGGFLDADVEAILQLEPDLVVGAPGPTSARLVPRLAALGIASWFPEMASVPSIDAALVGLGERTGHLDEARRVVDAIDAQMRSIEQSVAGKPMARVLLIVDADPVVAAGPASFIGDLLRRAGASNVIKDGPAWQTVGFERLADLDPDVVIDAASPDPAVPSLISAEIPGWRRVRAVQSGSILILRDERLLRPGPRVAEGLAVLARMLHTDSLAKHD